MVYFRVPIGKFYAYCIVLCCEYGLDSTNATGVPPPSSGTWQQWIDEGRNRFHKREGVRVKQAGKAHVKKEQAARKLREKEHDQMEKYVGG